MKPKSWWEEMVCLPDGTVWRRWQIADDLKHNQRPFGLLSAAVQEVMRECEVELFACSGHWVPITECWDRLENTYRVLSDFEPQYAEEPKPQLDPNEAPEGYVAVKEEHGSCCANCQLPKPCRSDSYPCSPSTRKDKCNVYFLKKPSEWGEWQEYEVDKTDWTKIRFKKGK